MTFARSEENGNLTLFLVNMLKIEADVVLYLIALAWLEVADNQLGNLVPSSLTS